MFSNNLIKNNKLNGILQEQMLNEPASESESFNNSFKNQKKN